jgi:hypothetical protein
MLSSSANIELTTSASPQHQWRKIWLRAQVQQSAKGFRPQLSQFQQAGKLSHFIVPKTISRRLYFPSETSAACLRSFVACGALLVDKPTGEVQLGCPIPTSTLTLDHSLKTRAAGE